MKVRFIPKTDDKSNPIVRFRCDMIIEALGKTGYDIGYYDEKEWADILVIASTEFNKWLPLIEKNKEKGQITIIDLSENEFRRMALINLEKIKGVRRYILSPLEVQRRFLAYLKRKKIDNDFEKIVRICDHVTVSSEDIHDKVLEYNRNCTTIYEPLEKGFPDIPKQHKNQAKSIVWIGMPNNVITLIKIKSALKTVINKTDITLKIITSPVMFDLFPKLRHGTPFDIEYIKWDLGTIWHEIKKADIGIAPLYEYLWKSPNKIATYWAAGLPVVASPSPVYSRLIDTDQNGLLASDTEEWQNSLFQLIYDPELRNRLGQKGHGKALSEFNINKISEDWLILFERLFRTMNGPR